MTSLDELGTRICVLGRSASGKSTLAAAIGRARDMPVVHLDRLRFQPGPGWRERPDDEFDRLHSAAISAERWVIEGGYSPWLPARLARATGVVLLDVPTATALVRYLRRTARSGSRVGGVADRDRVTWAMIRWIAGPGRSTARNHRTHLRALGLPVIDLPNTAAISQFVRREHLL